MKRFILATLGLFLLLCLSACGSSSSDSETESSDTPIDQTITFGDYIVKADSFSVDSSEEKPVITINLSVTNNSANTMKVNDIIGVAAYQGDTTLSDGQNLYHGANETKYDHLIANGESDTIDIEYQLDNLDTPVEFSVFNDSSLGLSDQGLGAGLDLQINSADNTVESSIYNEPNHG